MDIKGSNSRERFHIFDGRLGVIHDNLTKANLSTIDNILNVNGVLSKMKFDPDMSENGSDFGLFLALNYRIAAMIKDPRLMELTGRDSYDYAIVDLDAHQLATSYAYFGSSEISHHMASLYEVWRDARCPDLSRLRMTVYPKTQYTDSRLAYAHGLSGLFEKQHNHMLWDYA